MCLHAGICSQRPRVLNPLELDLQLWLPDLERGTECGYSGRKATIPNCWAISTGPLLLFSGHSQHHDLWAVADLLFSSSTKAISCFWLLSSQKLIYISLNPSFESQLLGKPAGYQQLFHVPQWNNATYWLLKVPPTTPINLSKLCRINSLCKGQDIHDIKRSSR